MAAKRRRIFAFLICMMFILVIFFSLFFIVKEENHHCTGEDCPICACVHQTEQTLKSMGTGMATVSGICLAVLLYKLMLTDLTGFVPCTSLVHQKVRLDN